jgi:cytochrome c oxidase assembly protein subunit 15
MAQALLPGGPVDMQKAWIEMIHRTLAGAVGVLIVVLVVMTWRSRSRHRQAFALALLALVLVIVQAGFGAYTVTLKLEPVIVTAHLLLGLSLLSCLSWLAVSIDSAWVVDGKRHAGRASSVAPLAALGLVVLAIQIALGGWVSTNYAVLACDGYPRCEGRLVPPMDFADGFALFRALGHTANGDFLPQAALAAIHWTHRNSALVLTLVLVALALALWRRTGLHREARNLVLLLALQWATGLANVLLGWPLIAAVVHSAGAAAMLVLLVLINYRLRSDPDRAPPQFMGAPATLSQ